jgi:hypothetical protein
MYLSTCHWLPTVGGHSAYPPRVAEMIYDIARGLPQEQALQALVDTVDLGWIVVHLDALASTERQRWEAPLPPGLERKAQVGPNLVLRVTRAPGPGDRRALLLSTAKTLGGVPLAPLDADCGGSLALVGPPPRALIAGRNIRLDVTVQNASTEAWPGWGLVPRHLLHLRACVTLRGARCRTKLQPLGVDVPAGGTVTIPVTMAVPRLALGPCDLRLELWQLGDGPLERCGLAPLAIPVDVGWQRDAGAPSGQGRSRWTE